MQMVHIFLMPAIPFIATFRSRLLRSLQYQTPFRWNRYVWRQVSWVEIRPWCLSWYARLAWSLWRLWWWRLWWWRGHLLLIGFLTTLLLQQPLPPLSSHSDNCLFMLFESPLHSQEIKVIVAHRLFIFFFSFKLTRSKDGWYQGSSINNTCTMAICVTNRGAFSDVMVAFGQLHNTHRTTLWAILH